MKKTLLPLVLATHFVNANESFPLDGFGYEIGMQNLAGTDALNSSFEGEWLGAVQGAGSPGIVSGSLDYPGMTSHGGSVEFPGAGNARMGRLLREGGLGDDTVGAFYLSVRMQVDAISGAYRGFELHNGGFDDTANRVFQIVTGEGSLVDAGVLASGDHFGVRILNSPSLGFAGDLGVADTDVQLFVLKLEMSDLADSDLISVWRNPSDLSGEALNPPDFVSSGLDLVFDRVTFARFGDSGIFFDEIRLGETWAEVTTGDDRFDSDGDGMRDDFENAFGLDNESDDSVVDDDAEGGMDGLTNIQELALGTNPQKNDTDDDGLPDGVETNTGVFDDARNTGTDPKVFDSDGDTFSDGDEVTNGTNPLDLDDPGNPNAGIIFLDGTLEDAYGEADVIQTIETGFGDNLSEWNAGYSAVREESLRLFLAGNVEANFNKLEVFIDSTEAVTTTTFTSAGNDGAGNMDGMIFDDEFSPDYHIIIRRGMSDGERKVDIDFADLATQEYVFFEDVFDGDLEGAADLDLERVGANTFVVFPGGMGVAYDDSNVAGIGGFAGAAADQAAALAVKTGVELFLPAAVLGNPNRALKVMVLQNNGDHNYLSNQTLGGLPEGTGNLGGGAGIDFSAIDGEQFFILQATVFPSEISIETIEVDGERVTLNLAGLSFGEAYYVQASDDLGEERSFMTIPGSDFTAGGETRELELTSVAGKNFFRIVAGEIPQ
ncbi:MAG: hypothetical protein ACON5H_01235 [Akkermansiaceae bacterium]